MVAPVHLESTRFLAGSGAGVDPDWRVALGTALDHALAPLGGECPDLLLLFAANAFAEQYPELLREAAGRSEARELAGCSGWGVIGAERELEAQPAVTALALRFPGGSFVSVRRVTQEELKGPLDSPGGWTGLLGMRPRGCTGLIALVDPFNMDARALIGSLTRDYADTTLVGGLASASPGARRTYVFCGTQAFDHGSVVVALGGHVALRAVVSQGCEPIGRPWTVTDAQGHTVRAIGNRPACEVLIQTLQGMTEPERKRAARNLLVGLAMDEYRDEFRRGDFLIRNLIGLDQSSGAIAIAEHAEVGQTLQFQIRDARAADEELRHLLREAAGQLAAPPAAALLFACNGRGKGLFGEPDHDVRVTRQLLGSPALAGFFCNGEIGPVGKGTYLHGFTASIGLFVPNGNAT